MSAPIFEALRDDHETQRRLLELVESTHGDSEGRRELFERLKSALKDHAKAEEQSLYAAMMKKDGGYEHARHSVAEHHELDELLEELDEMDYANPRWLATFGKLKDRVLHHLEEEEHQMFQMAGRVLSEERKQQLHGDFVAAHPKM